MKQLTTFEQLVLNKLQENEGGVVERSVLGAIQPPKPKLDSNRVDVHIKNIRRKLSPVYEIHTVRGVGYRLIRINN